MQWRSVSGCCWLIFPPDLQFLGWMDAVSATVAPTSSYEAGSSRGLVHFLRA